MGEAGLREPADTLRLDTSWSLLHRRGAMAAATRFKRLELAGVSYELSPWLVLEGMRRAGGSLEA